MLRTILLVTRGIIIDPRSRRSAMFVLLMAALLMVFAGSTFLVPDFSPLGFLVYWAVCAWITFAALLLGLWDMLLVRAAARKERRRLEKEMLDRQDDAP